MHSVLNCHSLTLHSEGCCSICECRAGPETGALHGPPAWRCSAAAILETLFIILQPVPISKPVWAEAERLLVACADTVPIALRMVMGKSFPQGPFKLGMPQPVINVGAIIYMIVSVVRPPPAL